MLSVQAKLSELVSRLKELGGDNLQSIILYGSAARGDFHEEHSDLNVLCLVRSASTTELARVAPVVHWWSKDQREPSPLFFTAEELRQSSDVFAIELLDMQRSHRLLHGQDLLSQIPVPMNLHRVQLEHELRTLQLKLRQQFLLSHGKDKELRAVLAQSISSALALLRHTLIALGEEPPTAPGEVFTRVATRTAAPAESFAAAWRLRDPQAHVENIAQAYGRYVDALGVVAAAVDLHLPKREWQRAGKAGS